MNDNAQVSNIWQENNRTLGIDWTDGRRSLFDVVALRRACPCAVCVDEWTREQRLDPKSVSEEIRPVTVDSVGRYAISVKFSDGHSTGIYTYKKLRELDGKIEKV